MTSDKMLLIFIVLPSICFICGLALIFSNLNKVTKTRRRTEGRLLRYVRGKNGKYIATVEYIFNNEWCQTDVVVSERKARKLQKKLVLSVWYDRYNSDVLVEDKYLKHFILGCFMVLTCVKYLVSILTNIRF